MPNRRDKAVIWPVYFDSARTRSQGRMVSLREGISNPSLEDVLAAALKAGLKPEVVHEKKHPQKWHECSGHILVAKSGPKTAIVKRIAGALKGRH